MSVIVKGLEMPTSEEKCKFFQPAPFRAPFCVINGVCHGIDVCPLIDVPTPHGRLIDADVLKQKKKHSNEFAENVVSVAEIDWTPTIIEAEMAAL